MQSAVVDGWPSLFELLQRFGIVVLLILTLLAGAKRKWVWGWHYDELMKDRDMWRALALKQHDKHLD